MKIVDLVAATAAPALALVFVLSSGCAADPGYSGEAQSGGVTVTNPSKPKKITPRKASEADTGGDDDDDDDDDDDNGAVPRAANVVTTTPRPAPTAPKTPPPTKPPTPTARPRPATGSHSSLSSCVRRCVSAYNYSTSDCSDLCDSSCSITDPACTAYDPVYEEYDPYYDDPYADYGDGYYDYDPYYDEYDYDCDVNGNC